MKTAGTRHYGKFFSLFFLFTLLTLHLFSFGGQALGASLEEEMLSELGKVRDNFAASEPQRGQFSDEGSFNSARKKWLNDFQNASDGVRTTYKNRDGRFAEIKDAIKSAGMEKDFLNSGSAPKTPSSDIDLTEMKPGGAKKLADQLNAKGYSIRPDPNVPGRYVDPAKKLVIWETPPNLRTGSPEWRNWVTSRAGAEDTFSTSGGLFETSGGKVGAKDPAGAVLDNVKKAVEAGIGKNPAGGEIDPKTIGKSVKKAMEWTGTTPKKGDAAEFARQAENLRKGRSWEEAGITSPNDPPEVKNKKIRQWLDKAQDSLSKSYQKAQRQSQKITDGKVKELTEILNKKPPMSKADQKTWRKLTDELHTISKSNGETLRNIAEKAPEIGGKITKQQVRLNPDGTVTDLKTGKTMTRSQFADRTAPGTKRTVPKVIKPELPKKPAVPMPPPPSKLVKVGTGIIMIYQGYEALKAYSDYLDKAAREDPENFGLLTVGKGIGYGVATLFGIPGLIQMGEQIGLSTREQYLKDLREGKEWLLPPAVWAGAYAAWEFGKSVTIGPLISGGEAILEGYGLAGDLLDARKAARRALDMKQRLDTAYKPLSDLMTHVIGGPLPPIWEKNRWKYYRIFKPILDDPEALDKLMKTPAGKDLWKWMKEYKDKRAKELGITFGSPGADNPDDNDNIGKAMLALPPQERGLYLRAAEKGNTFVMDFLSSRNRGAFSEPLGPETLGAFLQASTSDERVTFEAPFSEEQRAAAEEIYRDLLKAVAETPDVAILSSGYAKGAAALLGQSEPATLLQPGEAGESLEKFRLLILPSGSLSDWSLSETFRNAVEKYVSSGGTLLAFSQQLGKEYAVLPGKVTAYGFAEDQSCQYASARITASNGAFCSMTTPTPDFNVDGYFLDYPAESEIWLSRTKNDQPCMISFPWGKGRVVLSTLYLDWAAGNHQGTVHERLFFRDLVSFLLDKPPVLTHEGKTVRVALPEPETGDRGISFSPLLFGPDGAGIEVSPQPAAGKELELSLSGVPGFYRLGGVFTDGSGKKTGETFPRTRFGLSVLPKGISDAGDSQRNGVSVSVASDLENYIRGAEGRFSILLWNRGTDEKTVRIDWRFPHNSGSAPGAEKGKYAGSNTLVLKPEMRETINLSIPIVNTDGIDRLWVDVYDGRSGEKMSTVSKGFYTKSPSAEVSVLLAGRTFPEGSELKGEVSFKNPFRAKGTGTLRIRTADSAGKTPVDEEMDFEVSEDGATVPFQISLPENTFSGECSLQAFIVLRGTVVGVGSASFTYTGRPYALKGKITDRITGAPVSGSEVEFHLGDSSFKGKTDGGGIFEVDLPDGRYSIEASAEGFNIYTAEAVIAPEDRAEYPIALLPLGKGEGTGMVSGRVFDRVTGDPVPGCLIDIVRGNEKYTVKSDASARYSLALLPGDYLARCFVEGQSVNTSEFPFRVTEGWEQPLDLYPPLGKIRLRILDTISGKEVGNVSAILRTADLSKEDGWNRDISFAVNGGPTALTASGRRALRVSADGYRMLETEILAGERTGETLLYLTPKKGSLKVVCADLVSEDPLAGAAVSAGRPGQPASEMKKTGDDGGCIFNLEDGRWVFSVEAEGYVTLSTEWYSTVHAETEVPEVKLYLSRDTQKKPGSARIAVLDRMTASPVAGVSVEVASPQGFQQGVTDDSGLAAIGIPDGRVALRFTRKGYAPLETELFNSYLDEAERVFYLDSDSAKAEFLVRDGITGNILEGVRVFRVEGEAGHDLGITGKGGILETSMPRGGFSFRFELDGYDPLITGFHISGNGKDDRSAEEVFLSPQKNPHSFRGIVKTPAGEPLPGVSITMKQKETTISLQSLGDGTFALTPVPGPIDLTFTSAGYHELKTQTYFSRGVLPPEEEEFFLFPSDSPYPDAPGRILFSAMDALTGEPLERFSAYLLDNGWAGYHNGTAATESRPGNRNTVIQCEGYYETGSFYPTVFPGKTVKKTIQLHPSAGKMQFRVLDAISGEPVPRFSAYLLDNGWAQYENGSAETEAQPGNRNTVIKAPGYYETGSFYPTVFPGKTVMRTIYLNPSAGRIEFSVLDMITGKPIPDFSAYLLDGGWARYENGKASTEAQPGNRNTVIKAPGYNETGSFYPTVFPGRTIQRTVFLTPSTGKLSFSVKDGQTGKPLPVFSAYLLDGGWAQYRNGKSSMEAQPGNRNTVIKAPEYNETGSFYPTVFPGKTADRTIFLAPSLGRADFTVADVLTGNPLPVFSAYLLDNGWARYENGTASTEAQPGNRNTVIKADGYFETGFYPTAFPGRTTSHIIYLHPSNPLGQVNLKGVDLASGETVTNITFQPQGEPPLRAPDGTGLHSSLTHFKHQWFRASSPGYKDNDAPGFFTSGRRDVELSIPLERIVPPGKGNLLVSVADSEGKPLSGAAVALSCSGKAVRGKTNTTGQVLFRNAPSGIHTLSASARGYGKGSSRTAVEGGETGKAFLKLSPLSELRAHAPFDPVIVSAPSDEILRPGERKILRAVLENRGDEGGRTFCSLEIPDMGKIVRETVLGPAERAEIPFEVLVPEDSVNSRVYALVRAGDQSKRGVLSIEAPKFTLSARTDREAYLEGESLDLEVEVTSDSGEGAYQIRASFNDETRLETVKLAEGKGKVLFRGIPVSFRGNKLFYGLYHASGRSILLNALQVQNGSGSVLLVPEKQQYGAGETVRIRISGKAGEPLSIASLLLPGGTGGAEGVKEVIPGADGTAILDVPLPRAMATGSYPFRCGDQSVNVDIRGAETKILDRRLEEEGGENAGLLLFWKATASGEIPCTWSVEAFPADEESYVLAEGNITLKGEWGDYMVRVEPEEDEPCDFLLSLKADILSPSGKPLAEIRYSRAERE
ncbi:MAG: carboxypeptidase regulatory-like domain-containing protein [Aminivibrio sp.]|nr:carboxypeptidase regulatory-like domain-containing protein [Aminivibrio sp.]